jgi:hypothetical protein
MIVKQQEFLPLRKGSSTSVLEFGMASSLEQLSLTSYARRKTIDAPDAPAMHFQFDLP